MKSDWKSHLAMSATYFRMIASLPIVLIVMFPFPNYSWVVAILFILASLTDWLDGYWARKYDSVSVIGKLMDPIADKLLVLGALIMLLSLGRVDPVMVLLLLARDIYIGGIRSAAAAESIIIAARPLGKWKTGVQMTGIPCLLLENEGLPLPLHFIGYFLLWVSVLLSLASGLEYTIGYYKNRKTV